jgi:hypothetical protein
VARRAREAWWRPTRRYSIQVVALLLPALALPDAESLGRYLLWFALLAPTTIIATRYAVTIRGEPRDDVRG